MPHASTLDRLQAALTRLELQRSRPPAPGRVPAGVCVPLQPAARGLQVLMIKRPASMRDHAREVGFPGGKPEPGDRGLLDTALRETQEELGLERAHLHPLGPLSPVPTATSRYLLHPFVVAVAEPARPRPHPGEVAALIEMPVEDFFAGRVPYRAVDFGAWRSPIFDFDAGSMYGASAHVLEELLTVLAGVEARAMPEPEMTAEIPWR